MQRAGGRRATKGRWLKASSRGLVAEGRLHGAGDRGQALQDSRGGKGRRRGQAVRDRGGVVRAGSTGQAGR
jgi:hypothetical protein